MSKWQGEMILDSRIPELVWGISSAWRANASFALALVDLVRPDVIVDLGVDRGFSTFVFGVGGIGKVYGVDWFKGDAHAGHRDTYDLVMEIKEVLKLENVEIIKGDFVEVVKDWKSEIDILHIDGRHDYEDVLGNYELWSGFVKEDGVILLHDTNVFPGVKMFFAECSLPKFNFLLDNGLGVVCRSKGRLEEVCSLCSPETVGR